MLRRTFYTEAGPFDESLPMLAETRFAEAVRSWGGWLLFPAEIFTSARRFEAEGLYARQALNAIIMNFAALEWETFFRELPSIYTGQDRSGRIALAPMLRAISRLIAALPLRQRLHLWYATGAYVRSHAWQIPFFLDTRRNFRRGIPAGEGKSPLLYFHDRYSTGSRTISPAGWRPPSSPGSGFGSPFCTHPSKKTTLMTKQRLNRVSYANYPYMRQSHNRYLQSVHYADIIMFHRILLTQFVTPAIDGS